MTSSPLRVLFVGNSYTYYHDMPGLVGQLAAAAGEPRPLETELVVASGASLQRHWERGQAAARIREAPWDYVVLQEQSTLPIFNPAQMHEAVRLFDGAVKESGARTLLYLTWARRNLPRQQSAISRAYIAIVEELGATVVPVGVAWQRALGERSDLVLHMKDQSHPNPLGAYLAACVFYATLYETSPVGLEVRTVHARSTSAPRSNRPPVELGAEDAALLQRVAWETVQDRGVLRP
ncbi:MAG TPA: SGNH/GDSL hydrolase family protein [Dehalococcoidia bacterium]|nr:SGNH/GDSL hydrolase family protein [Dehalococcoidia bacterium]